MRNLTELTLDQALMKGVEAHKAGKLEEADRYYTAILKVQPKHPDANHNMGVLAVGVGKIEIALPFLKKALDANANIAQFWLSYIDALIKLNRMDDAKAVFDEAKNKGLKDDGFDRLEEQLVPSHPKNINIKDPPQDQLNSLMKLYDKKEFQQVFEKAQKLTKQYTKNLTLWNLMGAAAAEIEKLDEAVNAFQNAISIKPDLAEVYLNIGIVLTKQGKLEEATKAYIKAISLKPNYAKAYNNIGFALNGIILKKPNRVLQHIIVSLLDNKLYVRPRDIAEAAISLLKFEPCLQKQLKLVSDDEVIQDPLNIISDLDELSLLRKLMSVCPLPDLELEKLFKKLRASILENLSSFKKGSPELLRFQSALALQCFTNEYVYSQSKKEEKAIKVLEKQIIELLSNNEQPSPLVILIMASYKALNKYDWCQSLIVTNQIQDVFTRQVEEPNQEEKLKLNIPILAGITNKVSSSVREQYEENPYPRWVNLGLRFEPAPISKAVEELQLKLYKDEINAVKKPEILIAGCGTGQHSITTATRFKSSKVLAIDLSLSSLAYAKRKTEELAIKNIEYMQADILDLGQLNKQFDIIECIGTLVCMNNPLSSWQVLTDCLKPGGLMRVGLYSELARRNIIKIREEISQRGIVSSDAEMRSFRDMIIRSDQNHHQQISNFSDFFSLSELRDLLFHVQEHRFTIPLIKNHLNKLRLKFCGFESSKIIPHFKRTNKHKEDLYDLDKWQAYEYANPKAFSEMYQFWCQKDN